jgi:hypothetical protein
MARPQHSRLPPERAHLVLPRTSRRQHRCRAAPPAGRPAGAACLPGVCELGHVEEEARPLDEARNRLRGRTSPVESPPSERTPAGRHVRRCAGWQADAGGGGGAGTCWCFFLINT